MRSWARRSFAAATSFIALVICWVLLTDAMRRLMSRSVAIASLEVSSCELLVHSNPGPAVTRHLLSGISLVIANHITLVRKSCAGPRNEPSKARHVWADRGVRFQVRRRERPAGQQRCEAKLVGPALGGLPGRQKLRPALLDRLIHLGAQGVAEFPLLADLMKDVRISALDEGVQRLLEGRHGIDGKLVQLAGRPGMDDEDLSPHGKRRVLSLLQHFDHPRPPVELGLSRLVKLAPELSK